MRGVALLCFTNILSIFLFSSVAAEIRKLTFEMAKDT
jgi:hypothetical protein